MARPRLLEAGDVAAFRHKAAAGAPVAALSRQLGIGATTGYRIAWGKSYADVAGPIRAASARMGALPDDVVREIRARRAAGESTSELAREYNIGRAMCDRIVRGVTYRDAGGEITTGASNPGTIFRQTLLTCALVERRVGGGWQIWEIARVMHSGSIRASGRVERLREVGFVDRSRFRRSRSFLSPAGWQAVRALVDELLPEG